MAGVILQKLGAPEGLARRFLVTCMIVGFAALLLIGIAAAWVTMRTQDHTKSVNHTYDVEVTIGRLQAAVEQSETTRRGFVLTGAQTYLDNQRQVDATIDPIIAEIAKLTSDNPRQVANLAGLRSSIDDIRQRQRQTIDLVLAGKRDAAVAAFEAETNARRMRGIRSQMTGMLDEEHRLLGIRDAAQQDSIGSFYLILIAAGVLILVVAIISVATILRYTKDLGAARDRLQRLNTDLEGAVAERTVNLTLANEEIQRFAYIVSHDLRSPLVNVMGFTSELEAATETLRALIDTAETRAPGILTDEARTAARDDLPEAIGFIRTSTQKMDRLINAILRLSREGRRVLTPEPLDIADIAAGVRDSLTQIAESRGVKIVIQEPLPAVISDRLAVEQILSNLVENAIKYGAPDRPNRITISGQRQGDRRLISVADTGRGIAEADHTRIFDLFRRSGSQDQPGEGIGLAHVRALAYRLGGTIELSSTLGVGTTFTLSLPAQLIDTGLTP